MEEGREDAGRQTEESWRWAEGVLPAGAEGSRVPSTQAGKQPAAPPRARRAAAPSPALGTRVHHRALGSRTPTAPEEYFCFTLCCCVF